jgi:cytochrome P450
MTIDVLRTCGPSVFEAELPTIAYQHAQSAGEAHELIRQARRHGPIAMGPFGPEVLAYDLVRTVLRDDRFATPKGGTLAAQGVTSGELWDIVVKGPLSLDGAAHHRQRRLVSKAFTPKAAGRLRTTCADVIAELVYQHVGAGRCDVVADIARQYPIPIICALLGTPREDWHLFSTWADDIFKVFDWNVVNDAPDIVGAWKELEAYLDEMVTGRRDALTDDLLSDMMRAEVDGDRLGHDELLTCRHSADGGHRHDAQSTGRRRAGLLRSPRSMAAAGGVSRTGAPSGGRDDAVFTDRLHDGAHRR